MSFDSAAFSEAFSEAMAKVVAESKAEASSDEWPWLAKATIIFFNLLTVVGWIRHLAELSRQTWRRVRVQCFELEDHLMPLFFGLLAALRTITIFIALVLGENSVCHTLLRINKETDHRKFTLQAILSLSLTTFAARIVVGLVAFLLCAIAALLQGSTKILDDGYRVAISIYVLLDIMLATIPVFIIRTLSAKSNLKLSRRAILAMWSVACLATLLVVPVELDHPGTMDEFVNDWFFEIGLLFLGKEMADGLSLLFMLYPADLETLLQF